MKLVEIYLEMKHNILYEIGDSVKSPPGGHYKIAENKGEITFDFEGDKYLIDIRLPVVLYPKIAMIVDFSTENSEYELTNKNAALSVLSLVIGGIQEWILRYKQKYSSELLEIVYIKFMPKSEGSEMRNAGSIGMNDTINKRDRIYRMYLEKFAKKYGSDVSFTTQGGVSAKFNPPLTIK